MCVSLFYQVSNQIFTFSNPLRCPIGLVEVNLSVKNVYHEMIYRHCHLSYAITALHLEITF